MGTESLLAPTDFAAALNTPWDPQLLIRKRQQIRRALQIASVGGTPSRIAILGGSTTTDIRGFLELFLLKAGIVPSFYESGYNRYFEEAMYDDAKLAEFRPDVVFVCTSWVNVTGFPSQSASNEEFESSVEREMGRFREMWKQIRDRFGCVIVQNNFDSPRSRQLGNLDSVAPGGRLHFLSRLNAEFAAYARNGSNFYVNDIHYLSSYLGLENWFDHESWFSYKMAVSPVAAIWLARSVASILGSVYGKTRKCLVLDLDNTLWGGVIGDDGVANIQIGQETAVAESYSAFQKYVKSLRERGVLLAVCSKNDDAVAREGFSHPDSILKLSDFSAFRANWAPKHENLVEIARELNIGIDSLVFVDDNPAERAIVAAQLPAVAVPEVGSDPTRFAEILDAGGYFEPIGLNREDLNRASYYELDSVRAASAGAFASYDEFLDSLDMTAEIAPFVPTYLDRITQLTNKTNQFNLTTRRYTRAEMDAAAVDPDRITLWGRLKDKFGDNGLVSIVMASVRGTNAVVELWLMSCRVLKRGMEDTMFDALVEQCRMRGVTGIEGVYIPTAKNSMVANHYRDLGFQLISADADGRTTWGFAIPADYQNRNRRIKREIS